METLVATMFFGALIAGWAFLPSPELRREVTISAPVSERGA